MKEFLSCQIQNSGGLLARHRRELLKKIIERAPVREGIKEILDGNSRAREAGRAGKNIGIRSQGRHDHKIIAGFRLFLSELILHRGHGVKRPSLALIFPLEIGSDEFPFACAAGAVVFHHLQL